MSWINCGFNSRLGQYLGLTPYLTHKDSGDIMINLKKQIFIQLKKIINTSHIYMTNSDIKFKLYYVLTYLTNNTFLKGFRV